MGTYETSMYVDQNDLFYVLDKTKQEIKTFSLANKTLLRNISANITDALSIVSNLNGDIYVGFQSANFPVLRWRLGSGQPSNVENSTQACYTLFLDDNDGLYCSLKNDHQVIRIDLNRTSNVADRVAGTGSAGSLNGELNHPHGIFVHTNRRLYVADCTNNRIQSFDYGNQTGTTMIGNTTGQFIYSLDCPSAVILDANEIMYVVDTNHHRILGIFNNSVKCLAACSGSGSNSSQLKYPHFMYFDRMGNMIVLDKDNHRVQQFNLKCNSEYFC